MTNEAFWKNYDEVTDLLKQAFIQMPGGQAQDKQAQDPAAGGGMPPAGDPSAMGGDPAAMGGAPMDPAMTGGAPMDPAMMGGVPMDPSMMGMPAGGPPNALDDPTATPDTAPGSPMITISLDQLFEIIQKVLGLAKKVGANGQGVQASVQAPAESAGITPDQLKSTIYEALGSMAG